jgi:hypothetical protein
LTASLISFAGPDVAAGTSTAAGDGRAPPTDASFNRTLDKLAPGDVVMVTRIDRLARSTFDLFAIVKQIVDAKAQFRSPAEPWADG